MGAHRQVVLKRETQATLDTAHQHEGVVELRRPQGHVVQAEAQPGSCPVKTVEQRGLVDQGEHHVDQRPACRIACLAQRSRQQAERMAAMRQRGAQLFAQQPYALHAGGRCLPGAQQHGIHAIPHRMLQFGRVAQTDWQRNAQVVLPAAPVQPVACQPDESPQQGGAAVAGQRLQLRGHAIRQCAPDHAPLPACGRPWPLARHKIQPGRQGQQAALPVGEIVAPCDRFQIEAFIGGELRQRGGTQGRVRYRIRCPGRPHIVVLVRAAPGRFRQQQGQAVRIADDVMHHQQHTPRLRAQPEHAQAQQRCLAQPEGAMHPFVDQCDKPRLRVVRRAEVQPFGVHTGRRQDVHAWRIDVADKAAAAGGLGLDRGNERGDEVAHPRRVPLQRDRQRHVVARLGSLQAVEHPELELALGERGGRGLLCAGGGHPLPVLTRRSACSARGLQPPADTQRCSSGEQVAHGHRLPVSLRQAPCQYHGLQAVSSERHEIGRRIGHRTAEHRFIVRAQLRQCVRIHALGRCPALFQPASGPRRTRAGQRLFVEAQQGRLVDFAGWRHRQGIQPVIAVRQHVLGQAPAQPVGQRAGLQLGHRCAGNKRQQPDATALAAVDQHGGLADGRMPFEHRDDLAQLHPMAAQLHLLVHAPDQHQLAVFGPACTVAGTIHPPPAQRGKAHEAFRAQLRTVQIADANAGPAQIQFAGHAGRQAAAMPVEHMAGGVRQRPADAVRLPVRQHRMQPGERGAHRSFGGAVRIHIHFLGRVMPHILADRRLAGGNQHTHPGQRLTPEEGQIGRRPGDHRDTVPGQVVTQCPGGVDHLPGDRVQRATGGQRHEDFRQRRIEGWRSELQHPHPGTQPQQMRLPLDHVHKPGMRHQHALGLAGRARCVDQIGRGLGCHLGQRIAAVLGQGCNPGRRPPGGLRPGQVRGQTFGTQPRQPCRCKAQIVRVQRQQAPCAGVAEHVPDALRRVIRIDRQIDRTGPQDAQQDRRQCRVTPREHRDHLPRHHACTPHPVGHAQGARAQRTVILPAAIRRDHSGRVRAGQCLPLEQLPDRALNEVQRRPLLPAFKLRLLLGQQAGGRVQQQAVIGPERREQRLDAPDMAPNIFHVEVTAPMHHRELEPAPPLNTGLDGIHAEDAWLVPAHQAAEIAEQEVLPVPTRHHRQVVDVGVRQPGRQMQAGFARRPLVRRAGMAHQ